MKGLFSRTKTIRELKAIVRNLSVNFKKIDREFSKLLGIYCSWSRMNKTELTKVVDWFLGNFSLQSLLSRACDSIFTIGDLSWEKVAKNISNDLRLKGFQAYLIAEILTPFAPHNFQVDKLYYDPDFEEKYFDQYVYDENGITLVNLWEENDRKIGNKTRSLKGWLLGLLQDDDTWLVIEIDKKQGKNQGYYKMGIDYIESVKCWYRQEHRAKAA